MESMSNAELLNYASSAIDGMGAQFQYWLSVSFAAIVASFMGANRLTNKARVILTILYSFAVITFLLAYLAYLEGVIVTTNLMAQRGAEIMMPSSYGPFLLFSRTLIFVLGTVTTIWFIHSSDFLEPESERKVT